MSRNVAGGLRQGHDCTHIVWVINQGEAVDLTNYTVTAAASFDGGATEHTPTVSGYRLSEGGIKLVHLAADLDQAGPLAIELDFTPLNGAEPLNANARPIIVNVRAKYEEAS